MKSQMQDITPQTNTQEKKSKIDRIGVEFFYNKFRKENRKDKITLSQFKIVIKTFLKVYFTEVYVTKKTYYFFLGGKMKLVLANTNLINKNTKKLINKSLQLFWYNRPSPKMWFMVKFTKLSGSNSALSKIERLFNQIHNKDLLTIFTKEQKRGKKQKTLFRCIQT